MIKALVLVLIWSPFTSSSSPWSQKNPRRNIREGRSQTTKHESSLKHRTRFFLFFLYNYSVKVKWDVVIIVSIRGIGAVSALVSEEYQILCHDSLHDEGTAAHSAH